MYRDSKMRSVITLMPGTGSMSTIICACTSVGKARVGLGGDVDRAQAGAIPFDDDEVGALAIDSADAGFAKLVEHGAEVVRARALHGDFAAGHGGGYGEGCGFDAVGNDLMIGPVQFFDAGDGDGGAAGALDTGAHGGEEIREVDDLGFAGGAFDDGDPRAKVAAIMILAVPRTVGPTRPPRNTSAPTVAGVEPTT
jgi:hypothetical protein